MYNFSHLPQFKSACKLFYCYSDMVVMCACVVLMSVMGFFLGQNQRKPEFEKLLNFRSHKKALRLFSLSGFRNKGHLHPATRM